MTGLVITLNDGSLGIPLAPGSNVAVIDAADLDLVKPYWWRVLHGYNGKAYATAYAPRVGTIYMHRLIAGTGPGYETDHVNGDGLDNRRTNLRNSTPSQNRANTGKFRRTDGRQPTSQFKGVSWEKSRGRWSAYIHIDNRKRHLGRFDTEREAALAYDAAALRAWGPFAVLNIGQVAA